MQAMRMLQGSSAVQGEVALSAISEEASASKMRPITCAHALPVHVRDLSPVLVLACTYARWRWPCNIA